MASVIYIVIPSFVAALLLFGRWHRRNAIQRRLGRTATRSILRWDQLTCRVPLIGVLTAIIAMVAIGPVPGLAIGCAVLCLPRAIRSIHARRLADQRQVALPELVEQLSRSLAAGASTQQALLRLTETCPQVLQADLRALAEASRVGIPLDIALEDWTHRDATPGVASLVAMLRLGLRSGGLQASALEALSVSLRDALELHEEIESEIAQAKASVALMVGLPIVMGAASAVTGGSTGHFLFRTSVGSLVVLCGLGLDAVGGLWMRALIRRVQP